MPVRLIVRRVRPTPGPQLSFFTTYDLHAFITDRDGETLELEADHRRHAEVENAIRDLKDGVGFNHLPSGRFAANGAWLAIAVMAHDLARWTARVFLAGQARPGHKAIGEFRRRHLAAFRALFLDSLHLCQTAGMVKLGRVALDGTKVKANASKHKAMSYARMPEREAALEAEVARILEEAEAIDRAEDALYGDARGDELPEALRTREGRLRAIRAAKAELEAEAKARTGDPDAVPDPKAQRNFTDGDSRIMLSKPDGWIHGYNAQAVVDEAHQVIVATTIETTTTDTRSLPALTDQVEANTGRRPRRLLADAGYQSDDNLAHLEMRGIDAYVAVRRDRHSAPRPVAPRGRIPKRLSPRQRMARKLMTKRGRAHYARRKTIVEPVFGQVKEARRFRRFSLRGRVKVTAEWHLVCAVHNLGKLFRSGRAGRVMTGWPTGTTRKVTGWA